MMLIKILRKVMDTVLAWGCSVIFMILVLIGTYQIVVRYIFDSPSTVSEELLTYGFTWLALLASAYVFGKREHMRMGFLADKITGIKKIVLEVLIEFIILSFASIVMIYGGMQIVSLTMTQQTASLGVSMGIIYVAVLISGIMTAVYSILNMIELCVEKGKEGM